MSSEMNILQLHLGTRFLRTRPRRRQAAAVLSVLYPADRVHAAHSRLSLPVSLPVAVPPRGLSLPVAGLPVASPPLQGAIVIVEGDRIIAIERAGSRIVDHDLGNVAVLPGLVNVHTHLDLCGMRGLAPPVLPRLSLHDDIAESRD